MDSEARKEYSKRYNALHPERIRLLRKRYRDKKAGRPVEPLPPIPPKVEPDLATRFWSHVDKTGDCWKWTAGTDGKGYGAFNIKTECGYRQYRTHRIAYSLAVGFLPDSLEVCHRCDNPRCVRPDHLFLGTQKDNIRDAIKKGRIKPQEDRVLHKTHCPQGHPYDAANTRIRISPFGYEIKMCRKCSRVATKSWFKAHPEKVKAYNRQQYEKRVRSRSESQFSS